MSRLLRRTDGFTLPELLVTLSMSMIIMLGAFGLLDTAMSRTGETQQRVEATQRGRLALDVITRQLRSQVCLSATTPAMAQAAPLSATFYVDLSDTSLPVHQRVEKRILAFDPATGEIIESTYVATGAVPTTFPAAPTRTKVLLSNAAQSRDGAGVAIPVFRYYAFGTSSPPQPNVQLVNPTTTGDLGRIARIEIAYTTLAGRPVGATIPRGSLALDDQVYIRAADPNDPAPYPTCA